MVYNSVELIFATWGNTKLRIKINILRNLNFINLFTTVSENFNIHSAYFIINIFVPLGRYNPSVC